MTTPTNDDNITQLLKTIENLSAEIAAEEAAQKRASWRTTCLVHLSRNDLINLQVANKEQLESVAIHITSRVMAQREATVLFGIVFEAEPTFQGFTITDWVADVNKRMSMITFGKKRNTLEAMQKRAKELLSVEQKRQIELEALITQMNELTK